MATTAASMTNAGPACSASGDHIHPNVISALGHTPLVRFNSITRGIRTPVVAKLEMLNPGGSVKDRIGIRMIEEAERKGWLKPGGTIVEPTSGNTGVGLAMAATVKGYSCIFVMPDKVAPEKVALLRAYGAEVVICPTAVERDSPESYYSVADRLTREVPKAFQPNQYFNPMNPRTHYESTGPEIWEQTGGAVTAFVSSVGTGGTLAGTSLYLKERNRNIAMVCADPFGAAMWSWFCKGNTDIKDGESYAEGIGQTRVTQNLEGITVDEAYRIPDQAALTVVYHLLREEGLFVGLSTGINIVGAARLARQGGRGQTIVTVLCDSGHKYQSKLFAAEWLRAHNLDPDRPLESVLEL
jgi:cystathionine beta-synthase